MIARTSVAKAVRLSKERSPDRYCFCNGCLWNIATSGPCPKHSVKPKNPPCFWCGRLFLEGQKIVALDISYLPPDEPPELAHEECAEDYYASRNTRWCLRCHVDEPAGNGMLCPSCGSAQ